VPNRSRASIEIVLPEAPPELYLAWTAFTVAAEQKLRDRPHLRARAARAGFVTTPAAHTAHATIVAPLTEQSEAALREGAAMVAPVIEGDPSELSGSLDYLQQWGEWLGTSDAFQDAGISLPAPEVAAIRTLALKAIREHLDHIP
jgi:hypothetical protein